MKTYLLILTLLIINPLPVFSQSFSINDLIDLTEMKTRDIGIFLSKRGFEATCKESSGDTLNMAFQSKRRKHELETLPEKTLELRFGPDTKSYYYYTKNQRDFINAKRRLIKWGYYCGTDDNSGHIAYILFQKANMSLVTTPIRSDSSGYYLMLLTIRKIPSAITYAEDLLQFDSYQYLASFFGPQNIKSDLYYFSKNELKKCSVLYNGTKRQAVFIWGDEQNMDHLSYIIISNGIPTLGAQGNTTLTGTSGWQFRSGVYTGMSVRELLRLNQADFEVYGNNSQFSFMIQPSSAGKINFRTTAIMLSCDECDTNPIFNRQTVRAIELAKSNIPAKVHDIILYPQK